jgi:hypothetical protein
VKTYVDTATGLINTDDDIDEAILDASSVLTIKEGSTEVRVNLASLEESEDIAKKLALAGGKMEGNINMDNNNISNATSIAATSFTGNITDTNSNELITFIPTASAVNTVTIANAAPGAGPTISADGEDTNIDINLVPKGNGYVIAKTPIASDNSTKVATTAFVNTAITTGKSDNVSGVVAIANGGTGASSAENARRNLELYTGVYTITGLSGNPTSVEIDISDIFPSGKIPNTNDMIIFFSNQPAKYIKSVEMVDSDGDFINDKFSIYFGQSVNGSLKFSYYITIKTP